MKRPILLLVVILSLNQSRAQWTQTNGPYGGNVRCFAISGANLFAGTSGGVFLSTNDGASWTAVNTGLTNTNVLALAVSGTNLFAGTQGPGRIFLSTNNGTSWTAVNTGLTNTNVLALAVSGTNLFTGTQGAGVFLSPNNGTSWTAANTGLTNFTVRALAVSGMNLFAGTAGGVFLSTNNGTSWSPVNTGLTRLDVRSLVATGTNLFAGTSGGVFRSTNNGATWTAVNTGLPNNYVYALLVSGTNLFAGTGGLGIFLSTNNGTSWSPVNTGLTRSYVVALAVTDTNLFAGTPGGIFRSTNNGATWTAANTGLTNAWVWDLVTSGPNLFAGTQEAGVFRSTNNGTSWTAVNVGLTNTNVYALAVADPNLFAGTAGGGAFLSTNNGTSWSAVNAGLTSTYVRSLTVSGTYLFAGTQDAGIFRSTDNGTSWTAVNTGLTNTIVYALAVSGANLFAGTWGGGVFLSSNNGTSWTGLNTGLTNTYVSTIAVIGTYLFAGTYGGVFLSTNNGTNWASVNTGLTNTRVWALAISGTNLFAGTDGGVFLYTNNGTSWTAVNTGLENNYVYALAVSGTNLFAGTGVAGVWRRPLSELIGSSLSLTSPNGGENWQVGSVRNISWTSSGISNVKLEFTTDNGASWSTIIASTAASTGSYSWTIPNTPTTQAKVRISDAVNASVNDLSDGLFTISKWLGIEIAIAYQESDSRLFYGRLPQPQDEIIAELKIWKAPGTPKPTQIEVSCELGGVPMQVILNSSLVLLDENNDGKIDSIPCRTRPAKDTVRFLFTSQHFSASQYDLPVLAKVTSVAGQQFELSTRDTITFHFARHPTENRSFDLLRDAFSFPNLSSLSLDEFILIMRRYGIFGVVPAGVIAAYQELNLMDGRCVGMSRSSGVYFRNLSPKPLPGEPHSWDANNVILRQEIADYHISPLNSLTSRFAPMTNQQVYAQVAADLQSGVPSVIYMSPDEPSLTSRNMHAVLATKLTAHKPRHIVSVELYDSNWPDVVSAAIFDHTTQFSYEDYRRAYYALTLDGTRILTREAFLEFLRSIAGWLHGEAQKVFGVACPANIFVVNQGGQRFGFLNNGTFVNEISGASFTKVATGNSPSDSMTILYVPSNETFSAIVNGAGTGNLLFESDYPLSDSVLVSLNSDRVGITDSTICEFRESDSTRTLRVDRDGNGTIDTLVQLYVSTSTTSVESYDRIPTSFRLSQNYPNPFNPSTTISYELPHNAQVSLAVYDILGRKMAQLVAEIQQAGRYEVVFSGVEFASGVYLYRLQAGDFVQTKKLLLIR